MQEGVHRFEQWQRSSFSFVFLWFSSLGWAHLGAASTSLPGLAHADALSWWVCRALVGTGCRLGSWGGQGHAPSRLAQGYRRGVCHMGLRRCESGKPNVQAFVSCFLVCLFACLF